MNETGRAADRARSNVKRDLRSLLLRVLPLERSLIEVRMERMANFPERVECRIFDPRMAG